MLLDCWGCMSGAKQALVSCGASLIVPVPLSVSCRRYEKISEKKMATPTEVLCKGFPTEFVVFFQVRRLWPCAG